MTAVQTNSLNSCRVEMDKELEKCRRGQGGNSVNKYIQLYKKFGHRAEVTTEAREQRCRK